VAPQLGGARANARTDASPNHTAVLGLAPLEAIPHDLPVFVEQSVLDRWQTGCILGAAPSRFEIAKCSSAAEWERCLQYMLPLAAVRPSVRARPERNVERSCGTQQRRALDDFQSEFLHAIEASPTLRRAGCGAFLHACHTHCPGNVRRIALPHATHGTVTLDSAMLKWWRADWRADWRDHRYSGCVPSWTELSEQLVGNQASSAAGRCSPKCGALYPWPDDRKRLRHRARAVAEAFGVEAMRA